MKTINEIDFFESYTSNALAQSNYVTSSSETVDQQQTTVDDTTSSQVGDKGDLEIRYAQSFKLSTNYILSAFEIKTGNAPTGSPTGNWTFRIETDSGGAPSGTLADSNSILTVTPTSSANTVVKGTFDKPFSLDGSTTYWFIILCDNQSTNNWWVLGRNTAGGYANGTAAYSTDGGASWIPFAQDLYFKAYVMELQDYSESTIKSQGDYSLKGFGIAYNTYDSYTKLVSHFDGADAATAYTDPIAGAHTFYGNAQLSTAQKKFGSASLYLDGSSGTYTLLPASTNLDFGTGNFTIDLWMRPASGFTSTLYRFCSRNLSYPFDTEGWTWGFRDYSGSIKMNFAYDNSGVVDTYSNAISITADTWYHVAIVRSGTTLTYYLNGTACGTATVSVSLSPSTMDLAVGKNYANSERFNGYIDGLRVSNYARWTSNFTPPTSAYIVTSGGSLNKTLTKTLGSPLDLSDCQKIKFDLRSNRTGSNIKFGFHDSGGTTTEITPNITIADSFQTVELDISGVSNANKDSIDSIIITIVDAEEDNTFYLDNMFESCITASTNYLVQRGRNRFNFNGVSSGSI